MSMRRLGELEAAVMDCLWSLRRGMRVREVQEALADRNLAYTTVMTVMDNLHTKAWLRRDRVGRGYVYEPVVTREEFTARMMTEALGSSRDHVSAFMHFVDDMSDEDAASLKEALQRLGRRVRGR